MDFETIIYMLSDSSIIEYLKIILDDFKMLALVVGSPVLYLINKYWIPWTPWHDGDLIRQLAEKVGVNLEGGKK